MLTDSIISRCQGVYLSDRCPKLFFFRSLWGPCAVLSRFSGVALKICKAFYVVNQVQESYLRRGPQPPDTPDPATKHDFYLSKHMFYTRSDFGFLPVLCQLCFRQWCATSPFDTYFASVPEIIKPLFRLFRMIRAVGKHVRVRVLRIKERFKHIGVVHFCGCRRIVSNDFMLRVYRRMVLVAKKRLIVLLRPSRINIFLTKFLRVLFPFLRRAPVLDFFILLPRVSLARYLDKTRIYYLAFLTRFGLKREPFMFPYRASRTRALLRLFKLLYGRGKRP